MVKFVLLIVLVFLIMLIASGVCRQYRERSLIFKDVVVRVSPSFKLAMHIDTDEANAAACKGEVFGEIF